MIQKKLNIAISVINYTNLTGVELYIYELSRKLREFGHNVLITAPQVGGEIKEKTEKNGILVYDFNSCPVDWKPDVIHANEKIPTIFALGLWPDTAVVATIHSEYPVEEPFISERISKYICIRQTIQNVLVEKYNISKSRTTIIYNGVDFSRFKVKSKANIPKKVLFVGTIDDLRRESIEHLIDDSLKMNYKVKIVGKRISSYLDSLPSNVQIYPPTWDIEDHLHDVTETAGILLGRTTIEGWVADKPGWIYDVDLNGKIIKLECFKPPDDIEKFNIENVAKSIEQEYYESIEYLKKVDRVSIRNEEVASILGILTARSVENSMRIHDLVQQSNIISKLADNHQKLHDKVVEITDRQKKFKKIHNLISGRKIVKIVNKRHLSKSKE